MKFKSLFLSLLAVLCFTACSDDEAPKQAAVNHVRMTTESATTLTEDSQDSIVVSVMLGNAPTQAVQVKFLLEGNEGDILAMSEPTLTFQAGEKTKNLYLYSNRKSTLTEPRIVTLRIGGFSEENMDQFSENILITVNPDSDIPTLTEEQKALLKGYKDNLGLDVSRLMGKLSCKVKVIFPIDEVGEEGETVFSKTETQEYKAETILTLSEKATADRPVLKMVDNAMGLTSVFHKILNKEISISNQVGTSFPSVAEAVKYQEDKETFAMTLDNLVLNEDGSITFVGGVPDAYGDTIQGVPFQYHFSAWERQEKMAKEGATVDVVVTDPTTGEVMYTEPESPMSGLIENGVTFEPAKHLISSDISEDGWETGIWKPAASVLDFAKGTATFSFPWDHVYSSDWTLIEVTYTLHPAK